VSLAKIFTVKDVLYLRAKVILLLITLSTSDLEHFRYRRCLQNLLRDCELHSNQCCESHTFLLAGVKFYLSLIFIFHNLGQIVFKFCTRYLNKILLNIPDLRKNHSHALHHLSNLNTTTMFLHRHEHSHSLLYHTHSFLHRHHSNYHSCIITLLSFSLFHSHFSHS